MKFLILFLSRFHLQCHTIIKRKEIHLINSQYRNHYGYLIPKKSEIVTVLNEIIRV